MSGKLLPGVLRLDRFMSPDPNPDPTLSNQLAEWKLDAPVPPAFRAGVWRQIAVQEEEASVRPWTLLVRWFTELFARRQFATAMAALLILLGAGAGWLRARTDGARLDDSFRQRYIQSVDPYQAKRS